VRKGEPNRIGLRADWDAKYWYEKMTKESTLYNDGTVCFSSLTDSQPEKSNIWLKVRRSGGCLCRLQVCCSQVPEFACASMPDLCGAVVGNGSGMGPSRWSFSSQGYASWSIP
jgi:hypothetical protein